MKALFSFDSLEDIPTKNFIEVKDKPLSECSSLDEISKRLCDGGVICFNSHGKFSLYHLVEMIVFEAEMSDLYFTTFGLAEPAVRRIANMKFRSKLNKVYAQLDPRIELRQPNAFKMITSIAEVGFMVSHAKITVIDNDNPITIIGSQNWTRNTKDEAGVIICSRDVADFYKNYILQNVINTRTERTN